MKVWVEGWKHVVNTTTLLEGPIVEMHDSVYPLPVDELRSVIFDTLEFDSGTPTTNNPRVWHGALVTGGVRIAAKTKSSVALQGNYEINVEISAEELLLLATEATRKWPSGYLLERLAALRASADEGTDG